MNYTVGVQRSAPFVDQRGKFVSSLDSKWVKQGGDVGSSVSVLKTDCANMTKKNSVKGQWESVMAQLLRPRGEVVAVVPSDVDVDAAALAPPLVGVGSQTGGTDEGDVCPRLWCLAVMWGGVEGFTWPGCFEA